MERRVGGTPPETRCPQCGLVIKVTSQAPESCPVCGAKLPVPPGGPKGQIQRKGPIMLDQALFKSPRARESWAPRELVSAFLLTFFVVMIINFLIIAPYTSIIQSGGFDPILYFTFNMAGILIGITPVFFILLNKSNFRKLALKNITGQQWLTSIGLAIAFGFAIYAMQFLGTAINQVMNLSTGSGPYSDFIDASIGNKLFLLLPVAAAQIIGEFFYRGTVQYGILQWLQKRMPPLAPTAVKLRAWALSILLGTLFDFSLFFNPSSILPSLLVHAFVGWLFVMTNNVQAGMIAQGVGMVLAILFV
jgi:hypothetical protein